jgi:hypothetical protein
MKRLFIAILLIILMMGCEQTTFAQQTQQTKEDTCIQYMRKYSAFWKMDSLGKNGFRELFGYKILSGSDFRGKEWKEIAEFLGRSNGIKNVFGKTEYTYRLSYYSESFNDIGTLLLDIIVDQQGIITLFAIYEVDG